MTDAHDQRQSVSITWHYPPHEVREHDPYHAEFERVRRQLKAQGLLRCVVCGSDQQVELHHSHVEFSLQNGVDVERLNEALGLHLTPEDFAAWIDSAGNLEPLCVTHHRGAEGIHLLPEPAWNVLRVWKDGVRPVEAKGNI